MDWRRADGDAQSSVDDRDHEGSDEVRECEVLCEVFRDSTLCASTAFYVSTVIGVRAVYDVPAAMF